MYRNTNISMNLCIHTGIYMGSDMTTLTVTRENLRQLFNLKRRGESYNDVITRLLFKAQLDEYGENRQNLVGEALSQLEVDKI